MKKTKESIRSSMDYASMERKRKREAAERKLQEQEVAIKKAIVKNNTKPKITFNAFDPVESTIAKKAPKLLDKEFADKVKEIISLPSCRDIASWDPKGKGTSTQFISLASHWLSKYPTPKFLWSAFWEHDKNILVPFVHRIAKGESFAKMCQNGEFPTPLTKKQCHEFLQSTSDYTFISALRRVQILSHNGNSRLHSAWISNNIGKRLGNKQSEIFWDSVLGWFSKHPMLDLDQLGPLLDYISYRYNQDGNFSMKGRSPLALIRDMNTWHGELSKKKELTGETYTSSGFKHGLYQQKKNLITNIKEEDLGGEENIWRVTEILSSKELHREGNALHHCVYSYSSSILKGYTSIWSLSLDGEKQITIEVMNSSKSIVQARGKYNRSTTSEEFRVIQKWATENSMSVSISMW